MRAVVSAKTRVPLYTAGYANKYGDIIECVQKDEIEHACQCEGQQHFLQAADTTFMQGSLLKDFGFIASQQATNATLRGE
ncbi:hypothetical protein G9A89_000320 [Geosiphon pyriformis]|nr:hypothetical protein G9A89_000320 [Geosiphon pyriformis]